MRNKDTLLAIALAGVVVAWGLIWPENRSLDALGITLAVAATLPLAVRRRWPIPVLALHTALSAVYNTMEYPHDALLPSAFVALYTVASTGNRIVSLTVTGLTCLTVILVRAVDDGTLGVDALGTVGWLVAAIILGEVTRTRQAENTRRSAEEAHRQVTEERLRIARDLHDVLAHSITMIRVQASVVSHLMTSTTVDRETVTRTLDTITEACDQARSELRATVEVLRDPVPALPRLTDLAGPVRAAGIAVTFSFDSSLALPPAVEIAAYRIVQESLTNVVKHSTATAVTVQLTSSSNTLHLTVSDNGHSAGSSPTGHGLVGMTERARSVGGQLSVDTTNGFTVTATLPLGER